MKKVILMAFVAVGCLAALMSCHGKDGQTRSVNAKGYVPVICQDEGGKFSYYAPIRDYVKVYPMSLLDSIRDLPRTPAMKVTYRTIGRDSFEIKVFAPMECLIKNMDDLKFVYPLDAKYSVRKDIFWTDKQFIALAPKFWIVGVKNKIKHVYTPEGKMLMVSDANAVLHTAVEQPKEDVSDTVVADNAPKVPPIAVFKALEKPSK